MPGIAPRGSSSEGSSRRKRTTAVPTRGRSPATAHDDIGIRPSDALRLGNEVPGCGSGGGKEVHQHGSTPVELVVIECVAVELVAVGSRRSTSPPTAAGCSALVPWSGGGPAPRFAREAPGAGPRALQERMRPAPMARTAPPVRETPVSHHLHPHRAPRRRPRRSPRRRQDDRLRDPAPGAGVGSAQCIDIETATPPAALRPGLERDSPDPVRKPPPRQLPSRSSIRLGHVSFSSFDSDRSASTRPPV